MRTSSVYQFLLLAKSFLVCRRSTVCFAAFVILSGTGCTRPPVVSKEAVVFPACGSFPNCVNSASGEDSQAIEPISASTAQWQQLVLWISQQDNWEIVEERSNFLQAVSSTALLGFKDDVLLRFEPENDLIQVRSSSRLGYSDMGANRARVELLRTIAQEKVE